MNILVFDIETIPDVESGKKIYDLEGLSDEETANAMFAMRRAKVNHEFLPLHLHKVIAISLVLSNTKQIKVWSLGDESADEKELITRFYGGLDKYTPTLVSFNGSGFDLPVLHYRSLLHGVSAPSYWETGDNLQSFKWNNYLNRYHYRHTDIMDILAGYQAKANAPLDELATMIGFPGKMGMSGAKVWDEYCRGNIKGIRDYCETDVLNTYGVYLKFELMRGNLSQNEFLDEITRIKEMLSNEEEKPHLQAFLEEIKI